MNQTARNQALRRLSQGDLAHHYAEKERDKRST
jgi:hypothetical protein